MCGSWHLGLVVRCNRVGTLDRMEAGNNAGAEGGGTSVGASRVLGQNREKRQGGKGGVCVTV